METKARDTCHESMGECAGFTAALPPLHLPIAIAASEQARIFPISRNFFSPGLRRELVRSWAILPRRWRAPQGGQAATVACGPRAGVEQEASEPPTPSLPVLG